MRRTTRRDFLKTTAAGVAGVTTLGVATVAAPGRVLGANERFRMAVCGLNGRGNSHIGGFGSLDDVDLVYLVDPDSKVLERRLREVRGDGGSRRSGDNSRRGRRRERRTHEATGVADVRKVLEDKSVDAISVATPNHWHSLMAIWAAQAGKHCYVEKPASHDIYEGRVATEAWSKYGVVIQHGTQSRSSARIAGLHEAIQAGKWGKLKIAYGYCCKPRGGIGLEEVKDPPPNLDWNLWRGPASIEEYHDNYVHYDWHWFWKSGNGDLNNQGTHQLDIAYWAIDKDQTHPVRAMAIGGRFNWDDQGETPNTMFALAEYPNGQWVFFNVRNVNYKGYQRQVENEYYFEDGGRIIRDVYYPKGSKDGEKVSVPPGKVTPGGNWAAFVAACRAGDPMMANGNMRDAHHSCVLGHLMNNSYRLGEEVPFNAKAGRFGDNKDAYEHFMKLHEITRDGCGVPEDEAKYTVGPWLTFDPKTERFTGDRSKEANVLVHDQNRKGFEVPSVTVV